MSPIETVGDGRLAAHLALTARRCSRLGFAGNPGDGMVHRQDSVLRSRKGELNRSANLAGIELVRRHDGAERAHVIEILTHESSRFIFGCALAFLESFVSRPALLLEDGALAH